MEKENIISTNFIMTNRDIIAEFGVNSAVMLGELYGSCLLYTSDAADD